MTPNNQEALLLHPPEAEADPAQQKPFQLVKYFSVTSLVIILLFTMAISTVVSQRASQLVLHKREQYALLLAENLNHQVMVRFVVPALRDHGGINVGQPSQFSLLDAVVKNTIHSFQVRQVNILDLDGNIIYSTQPEFISRLGSDGEPFRQAVAGSHASVLEPPLDFLELGGYRPMVLKTFIPLRDERRLTSELGPARAVFEITLDVGEDFKEIWRDQLFIVGMLVGMMVLLFVILRTIVIRGQRIMGLRAALQASLEEQLHHSERLAALGRMIAGVAHEIRNPLGIVRSTAELLGSRVEPKQRPLAQVIVEESTRLGRIVTEFLDFARPQTPDLRPLVVEQVLERNLAALAPEAQRSGVEVVRRYNNRQAPALGDADLLYRAFLNVFNNAIQAMEEQGGGRLTVSTSQAESNGRQWVVIAVEDTGPGFEPEAAGRLFDPFFTTKEQGTGLGLSIVSSIVASHRGRVEVGQAAGGGARVEVRLRAA
ncbi:MAG: GHKL domain-containing protein [Desulfarculus sp.]|nr:GHKL domain-containing protein [Desulfarculus sp.]